VLLLDVLIRIWPHIPTAYILRTGEAASKLGFREPSDRLDYEHHALEPNEAPTMIPGR
jgi:hypothetical protein